MPRTLPRSAGWASLRVLITLVLVVAVLYLAKEVVMPLALAVLLTFILSPIVLALQRFGLKRVYAAVLTVILALAVIGLLGWGVGIQVERLATELPQHKEKIRQKIGSLRGNGGVLDDLLEMAREVTEAPPRPQPGAEGQPQPVVVAQPSKESSLGQVLQAVAPVLEPLAMAGLVVILVVFMLVNREDLRDRLIGLLGHGRLAGTTRVFEDAAHRLSRFLLTQLFVNAGFGLVLGVGLWLLGVPFAFLWGFLAGVLRFVPYIGTWIAAAFPILISFALAPDWKQPLEVLGFFALLDLVTANIVEPLLFGHHTGVTPIALLVAAAFWTWVWGPLGLVLSTPLTVCLVVLGQHVPQLRFLALLLSDRPALPAHVGFYQRLLAKDRPEARQRAEAYGQEHGWENVYDDVLIPALALARRDRDQGALTAEEEAGVYEAMQEILDGLGAPPLSSEPAETAQAGEGTAEAPAPPPERPAGALVVGCPAHHVSEELIVRMLGQLLQPLGHRLEEMPSRALPSEVEALVDELAPAVVFIAVLPPGGLAQAGYLCKRLAQRFPRVRLVVGYWGDERQFDRVLVRLRGAGASYVTTLLLQARSQIDFLTSPPPAAPRRTPPSRQPVDAHS